MPYLGLEIVKYLQGDKSSFEDILSLEFVLHNKFVISDNFSGNVRMSVVLLVDCDC